MAYYNDWYAKIRNSMRSSREKQQNNHRKRIDKIRNEMIVIYTKKRGKRKHTPTRIKGDIVMAKNQERKEGKLCKKGRN